MAKGARVTSIDAIRDVRAALCAFIEDASVLLSAAQSDIRRTVSWLQHDQRRYWERERRKRAEKFNEARGELVRAQLAANESGASCVIERKAAARAEARLREAESKLKRSVHWATVLEREFLLYRGQCQPLSNAVTGDLPQTVAKIERAVENLEAYVRLAPESSGGAQDKVGSVARASSSSRPLVDPLPRVPGSARAPDQRRREQVLFGSSTDSRDEAMLVQPADRAILDRLELDGTFPSSSEKVVLVRGCFDASRVVLERIAPAGNDSGWFMGPIREVDAGGEDLELEACSVGELVRRRPAVRDVLALPPGWLVVIDGDEIQSVLDEDGDDAWSVRS